jgi:flagellar basal-body rod modification protein FlgD
MSQLSNVSAETNATGAGQQAFGSRNSINDLDLDAFLKLMITELQNQDPLNPLENDQLISQIGEIRSVGATDKLTQTLDTVLLGQNLSSATNLIGTHITGLSDDNQRVDGLVDRISITNGQPKLHLELGSTARANAAEGQIEAGQYQYRVVWQDPSGTLLGVDPLESRGGSITTRGEAGTDQAIRLGNLPVTDVPKQIYRTDGSGNGKFHLVGTLADGASSTFLDTTANADLSQTVLNQTPQFIQPIRSVEMSLNNIGEIRPPGE